MNTVARHVSSLSATDLMTSHNPLTIAGGRMYVAAKITFLLSIDNMDTD